MVNRKRINFICLNALDYGRGMGAFLNIHRKFTDTGEHAGGKEYRIKSNQSKQRMERIAKLMGAFLSTKPPIE